MKTILRNAVIAGTSLTLVVSPLCFAQTANESSAGQAQGGTHAGAVVRGKKLENAKVFTTQGEQMGTIDDVLLDPKTGQISHAVLGIGGWLGIGEKRVIVPWQLVQQDPQKPENFVVQADKEKLRGAPSFEGDQWASVTQPDYLARVEKYFGVTPQHGQQTASSLQQSQQGQQQPPQTSQEEKRRIQQAQQQAQEMARQQTQQQAQAAAEQAKRAQQQADEAQRNAQQAQQRAQQEAEKARQAQQAAQQVQQQQGAQVGTPQQ